ncbi:unnamed protein product [Coregonus sp. 'balchen']|nr:unnamed protein product [Coregonus sp. 'balchen']
MSAAQTQKDSEGPWGLDSLGLSQRELVMAEALQMEYDALSRLKQDKGGDSQGTSSQGIGKLPTLPPREGQSQIDRHLPPCPSPIPPGGSLLRGLSGSDPSLNHLQPGGSHSPRPSPARATPPLGSYSKDPLYILESSGKGDYLNSSYGHSGSSYGSPLTLPKGFPPPPDDPPPAVPPRTPLPPSSEPFLPLRPTMAPRDVNLFTPEVDQPKLSSGETLNYESLNDALSKLNGDWLAPRGRRANGDQSGKPVARSKTLPPQVPPRTYVPIHKSNKNQRRVSADPVSLGPRLNGFGYELFQVLRSAYPSSDRSKNSGFVWSPSVGPEELQQGFIPYISLSLEGSSTVDLLIYQTLCYANEDLDHIDVDHYLLKVCGQAEFLENSLAAVETPDITSALNQLPACPCRLQPRVQKDPSVLAIKENREKVVEKLTAAILDLVELYCSTFNANFHTTVQSNRHTAPTQEAGLVTNVLYEGFFLSCSLTHGGAELCAPQHTSKQQVSKYLFHLVVWDQRVCFPVQINQLPRETQLTVTLYASALPPPGGAEEKGSKQRRSIDSLGWVDFPTSSFEVRFSTPPPAEFSPKYDFSRLDQHSQRQLQDVLHKKSLFWLTPEDKRLLWEKRSFCQSESGALPLVLASAPRWDFPDQELRRTAVQWMDSISDPELLDFLPQLCYLDSPLVRFLLRRAIGDMRIAHYLFWLLKDTLQDSQFSGRYQHLLAGLLCCVGRGLREEFDRQCWLVTILAKVAQRVRDASPSSRQAILREGLEEVKQFFSSCSYFNSNAVPLKLSFQNLDPRGDNINSGDDLRQDMLTLQIIRIMNKIWIQEGLDMRMVIFRCFSTGRGRGMVEMIPQAETLRKIQGEHGVTGCCVATYILGICDRHNDNIMLKTSGHMFHIDFGKFLGHAQMFGNIKRDRAPFVFTSDMAYVINGGDKPSSRFHDFVDLLIESSLGSVATKLNFFIHNLAQMKFASSEERPVLSFAPRVYTLKTDGLIRNLFAMADRRKDELNGYVWHLVHAAPEVAQCDLIYTFFHPLQRDEKPGTVVNTLQSKPAEICWAPVSGKVQPLQDGTDPDPYVKLYLLPDPQKTGKRKTKAARRTCNPTYNEMLVYDRIPRGDLQQRVIHLRVLGEGAFWENTLLGEAFIPLKTLTAGQCWADWHQLGTPSTDSTR